jgi:glycosyltransferase involved in cell wall biosynthesis
VVVNNNSNDTTASIAANTLKRLSAHGLVINEMRQGKGNAVRRAFTYIDADIYVMSDADQTYPANRVHDLIRPIAEHQADMVVGDRQTGGNYKDENKRIFHSFGNDLVKALVNGLFHSKLVDIMSGYRAFSRQFVKNYPILVEGFQIETDVTLHALDKRFRIVEIPVEYKDRPQGSLSKLNTFADGAKVLFTIAQILRYYRPLAFFGGLSLLFAVTGLVVAIPVFQDWEMYRYIHHVPSAILAAAIELMGALSLSVGLILDSITHQHKMRFEMLLLNSLRRT